MSLARWRDRRMAGREGKRKRMGEMRPEKADHVDI